MLEYKVTLFASLMQGEITWTCYVQADNPEQAVERANEQFDEAIGGGSGWKFDTKAVKVCT